MNTEDFENQLQRVKMRGIPAEWRGEILQRAEGGGMRAESGRRRAAWWRELLWPSPLAWGALASIWMVIWLTNGGTPGTQLPPREDLAAGGQSIVLRFALERSFGESKGVSGL